MKKISLTLDDEILLCKLARALSSTSRVRILRLLNDRSMSVNEIAAALEQPVSTTASNIEILEDSGLLSSERHAGVHGQAKLCKRDCESIFATLHTAIAREEVSTYTVAMGIGHYCDCGVKPECGLAGESGRLTEDDEPTAFYSPERVRAQLIWFSSGFLEYRFPRSFEASAEPVSLELSFEACSEAPFYRNDWPSDVTVWIAGREIGTWRCPGDFGGRRGRLTPVWWSEVLTQYGLLKTWMVDNSGSYLDNVQISDVKLQELSLGELPYIPVRIGIKENAEIIGGINLFGECFGDHPQGLLLTVHYVNK